MARLRVAAQLGLAGALAGIAARFLAPRDVAPPPAPVQEHFSAAEVRRARRFGRPQLALAAVRGGMQLGLCVLAVRADREGRSMRSRSAAALNGGGLSLLCAGAPLPVSALMRRRSLKAGLATQGWRAWGVDVLKGAAIETTLAAGGALLAQELMARFGRRWWLPGAGVAAAAQTALTWAAPLVLEPLFNDFEPLPEGDLRQELMALAASAGVRLREIHVVDASRRTSAANAYVSGLGPTRRLVLWDTLLERFTAAESRLVCAHELAHVHHRDVPRGVVYGALSAPAGLWAGAAVARQLGNGVPALALGLGLGQLPAILSGNRLSRAMEVRADRFALALAGDANAFVSFERRIALQNLLDPDPPPWLHALLATHPTTLERISLALGPRTPAGS